MERIILMAFEWVIATRDAAATIPETGGHKWLRK